MSIWDEILGAVSDSASSGYNNVSDYVGSAVDNARNYWSQNSFDDGSMANLFNTYTPPVDDSYSQITAAMDSPSMGGGSVAAYPLQVNYGSSGGDDFNNLWGFTDWADRNEKGLNALGKWGIPAIGAGISMWDASTKNKLLKKQQQEMSARLATAAAERAKYSSPVTFANQRSALSAPTERGGQAVWFADNRLPTSFTETSPFTKMAEGGSPLGYVGGGTPGQADKIPAMLSDGEFVVDADTVSALGDGNNAAGASALEQMRQNIRKHKRSAPVNKIPPKAKKPEQYLKKGK